MFGQIVRSCRHNITLPKFFFVCKYRIYKDLCTTLYFLCKIVLTSTHPITDNRGSMVARYSHSDISKSGRAGFVGQSQFFASYHTPQEKPGPNPLTSVLTRLRELTHITREQGGLSSKKSRADEILATSPRDGKGTEFTEKGGG